MQFVKLKLIRKVLVIDLQRSSLLRCNEKLCTPSRPR